MQKIVSRQRQQGEEEEEEQQLSHPKRAREKGDPEERWNAQQRCSFNFFFLSWIVDGDTIKSNNNNKNNRSAFKCQHIGHDSARSLFCFFFSITTKGSFVIYIFLSFLLPLSKEETEREATNHSVKQRPVLQLLLLLYTHTHYTYSWPSAHFVYTRRCVCLGRPLKT